MKTLFSLSAVVISIIMIAAGAVNPGATNYWLAVPFMFFLIVLGYQYNKYLILAAILYSALAISVNLNQEKILYPIIKDGKIIMLKNGYLYYSADSVRSKFFTQEELSKYSVKDFQKPSLDIFLNSTTVKEYILPNQDGTPSGYAVGDIKYYNKFLRVKKGDSFSVKKMTHSYEAFSDQIHLQTEVGSFEENDYVPYEYASRAPNAIYTTDKNVRLRWVAELSNLLSISLYIFLLMGTIVLIAFSRKR